MPVLKRQRCITDAALDREIGALIIAATAAGVSAKRVRGSVLRAMLTDGILAAQPTIAAILAESD